MFEHLLEEGLHELNIICSECDFRYDVDKCNSCPTFKDILHIRKELDKHDVDDICN